MRHARLLGYRVRKLVEQIPGAEEEILRRLEISELDLARFYDGRILMTFRDISAIAEICNTTVNDLLNEDDTDFYESFHYHGAPLQPKSMDRILDIIDAYIDVREAVEDV